MARILGFGPFQLDLARACLLRDGEPVPLQPKAFELLVFLAERGGNPATRDEIHAAVWPGVHVGDEALTQMIFRVRRALGDERPYRYVDALPRRGYRILAPVHEAVAADAPTALPGRAGLLARLERALLDPGVLLLLGPGGIGKTTLAREIVARRGGSAAFVDLSAADDDGALVQAVARALDLPATADVGALAGRIGRALADRGDALVVLDNLEQLAGPAARRLQEWRAASPRARLLGTSRCDLDVEARTFEVEPLPREDAARIFERVGPLPAGEREPLLALVDRLDGNPLAVELAASRYPALLPSELLARVDARPELLRRGSGRHGDLEQLIDWSWRLLDRPAQDALLVAALFHDGFSPDDLEAILGPPALDALQELLRHRLVTLGPPEGPRFRLHASVRAFGRRRAEGREDLVRAQATWLLGRVQPLADAWERRPDAALLARLAATSDAMHDLSRRLAELDPERAHRAALLGAIPLSELGPFDLAYERASRAVDAADPGVATHAAALLLRLVSGGRPLEDALTRAGAVKDRLPPGAARTLLEARIVAAEARVGARPQESAARLEQLRAEASDGPDRLEISQLLAEAWIRAREPARTEALVREVLAACRTPETDRHRRLALLFLANLAKADGRFDEAAGLYEEGLALAERMGSWSASEYRINLANLHSQRGRWADAERAYLEIRDRARATHDEALEMLASGNLATSHALQGRYAEARDGLRDVLARAEAGGHAARRVWALFNLGVVSRYLGRAWEAAPALSDAREAARAAHLERFVRLSSIELAATLADLGRPEEAERELPIEPSDPTERALHAAARAYVALARGQRDEALARLAEAAAAADHPTVRELRARLT
jgi:DNA-binding winged helix-turn-helix (wHTH) protein/tetratricopeptide (TPR) repeat protein